MTVTGVVVKTDCGRAVVRISRQSACGHSCGECRLCDVKELEATVENSIGAKEGDSVEISSPSLSVLKKAFFLYILPLVGLFALYIIGEEMNFPPFASALSAVCWCILWFIALKKLNVSSEKSGRIVKIL